MSITHIASFTTRVGSVTVPAQGFGVPLIAAYHTVFPQLVKEYAGTTILQDMVDEGFSVNSAVYRMATKLLSQERQPSVIKVGRLQTPSAQSVTLVPVNVVEGYEYSLTVTNVGGSETASYTVQAADTATEIATALFTAINAFTSVTVTATDNTGSLTLANDVDGETFSIEGLPRRQHLTLVDNTPDPGIAADLSAIEEEDAAWYCLLLDNNSTAIANAAGDWVAARKAIYIPGNSDSNLLDAGVTADVASNVLSDANVRVGVVYDCAYNGYAQHALAGKMLPQNPGSATWNAQTLRQATPCDLTGGDFNAAFTKRATVYRKLNSQQAATYGGFVGGDNIYLDVTRSLDWLDSRAEEAIASLLLSAPKVPFTAAGLSLVRATLQTVVSLAVSEGILSPGNPEDEANDPTPKVIVPNIGDISAADKAARCLPNVQITGKLAGAIHKVVGTIVVDF